MTGKGNQKNNNTENYCQQLETTTREDKKICAAVLHSKKINSVKKKSVSEKKVGNGRFYQQIVNKTIALIEF